MQLEGLVWCIECGGNHHLSNHVKTNPSPKLFLHNKTSSSNVPLTWPYYPSVWPSRQDNGLLGHGYDTWHRYLIWIIMSHNSPSKLRFFFFFPSYLRRKIGFWLWHTNPARFFDFHTWKRHFACPTIILVFRSLQRLIKCSRQRFVPHILRRDGDPTTDISP